MIDVRAVLRHARRQSPPPVDPAFVEQLEARLRAGHGAPTAAVAPSVVSRHALLGRVAAVVLVVGAVGLAVVLQRGGGDASRVRTESPSSITTSTVDADRSGTTVVTTAPEVPSTSVPSTTEARAGGSTPRSTPSSSTTEVPGGGAPTGSPTTTTPGSSPQQQYVTMSCVAANGTTVTCEWGQPTVAVAEWHIVRRHAGDNEVPLPSTQQRRVTDPTASPGTTYTYVVNGYDASGHSVALGSASVTTPSSTSPTTAPAVQELHLACVTNVSPTGVSCQWDASTSGRLASYRLVRRTQDGPETVVYTGPNRSASESATTGARLTYTVTALASDGTVLGRGTTDVTCC